MELALEEVKANFSLQGGAGEPFEFRLHRVPIDETSIFATFLAVQVEVNERLQARGIVPWGGQWGMPSLENLAPGAAREESISERVDRVAQVLSEVVAATTGDLEAMEAERVGCEDAILLGVLGRGLVTVLWVNPRYLTQSRPEAFEAAFNELLNGALAPLTSLPGALDHG